jgi:hypothetical protein
MKAARSGNPGRRGPALLDAIRAVGDLLAAEGETAGIVVGGGAALILGGTVSRVTENVDIIAAARSWRRGVPTSISRPDPLPASLLRAVSRVARDFNLPENWMNTEVGAQWDRGLPPGFEKRVRWLQFGGLSLGIADRRGLTFLKLYAAVHSEGPQSVHYQDLLALRPSNSELAAAARWMKSQDTSTEFAQLLEKVLDHVHRDQEEPR